MVNGAVHTGTPKTHASRSVPYPDFLEPALRAGLRGKAPDQLLFGEGDEHLRLPNSKDGWFAAAVRRARAPARVVHAGGPLGRVGGRLDGAR